MAEGKFKYELSDVEVLERGRRQATVDGRIDLLEETKATQNAKINAELKALRQERRALSLAIREGYEWREVAEQEEMELVTTQCSICYHQQRFALGVDLAEKLCDNCRTMGSLKAKDAEADDEKGE